MEHLNAAVAFAREHAGTIALALTWVGILVAWWGRRRAWRNKEFLGRVNFSLNLFGDALAMRTLLECDTAAVWPNPHGLRLLDAAAARTSDADPFLRLARPADRDYLHRAVKNAVSQLCPAAFVAKALGAPVRTGVFLFALTCERHEEGMRTIKLRVLLVEENTLREWCGPGGKGERLPANPVLRARLKTLQRMHEMDRAARAGGPEELGRVELGVPGG